MQTLNLSVTDQELSVLSNDEQPYFLVLNPINVTVDFDGSWNGRIAILDVQFKSREKYYPIVSGRAEIPADDLETGRPVIKIIGSDDDGQYYTTSQLIRVRGE